MFFLYIILFNVPIIFILISHHLTLNESVVEQIAHATEEHRSEEFQREINKATHIDKKEYMKSNMLVNEDLSFEESVEGNDSYIQDVDSLIIASSDRSEE